VAVVVDDGTDPLAGLVADAIRGRGVPVEHVAARRLGLLDVRIERSRAFVAGQPLRAVLFRAGPWTRHDDGYIGSDATFATSEVSATWLAITNLESVATLNRLGAEAWSSLAEWSIWRRRLEPDGVPHVEVAVGAVQGPAATWLPWGGGVARAPEPGVRSSVVAAVTGAGGFETSVWLDAEAISGHPTVAARHAAEGLIGHGVRLAGITVDGDERVAAVTARPRLGRRPASAFAGRIAERLCA
jgi:hypothetical protein